MIKNGCRCIKFDDSYSKHNKDYGIFTSPNWPFSYDQLQDSSIDCLLYTFIGKPNQIVQLSFDSFELQRGVTFSLSGSSSSPSTSSSSKFPSSSSSSSDECSNQDDFVKLYLDLDPLMDGINEWVPWSSILCGKSLSESQVTHYSTGPRLILAFHLAERRSSHHSLSVKSDDALRSSSSSPVGFSGAYRFLNKSDFSPDGEALSGTPCDYQFLSISNSDRTSGKFFSPNFPSAFPRNTKCAYHFMGRFNHKIRVVFEKVDLANDDLSCLDSSDSITVYDGRNSQSPMIAQLCNNNGPVNVISTGSDLYIEFVSGSSSPTGGQGFRANYHFFYLNHQNNNHLSPNLTSSSSGSSPTSLSHETRSPSQTSHSSSSSSDVFSSFTTIPSRELVAQIPSTEPDEDKLHKYDETATLPLKKSVRISEFSVPSFSREGETISLICTYELDPDVTLYATKWYRKNKNYRDESEFFRFEPNSKRSVQVFPHPYINLNLSKSHPNGSKLVLENIRTKSSGVYKCEVILEQSFIKVSRQGLLQVLASKGSSVNSCRIIAWCSLIISFYYLKRS